MDPLERDFYEERRRKWRRSAFWRGVLATIGVIVALGIIGAVMQGGPSGPHIARVYIHDIIYDDPERTALLAAIRDDDAVEAVIVRISSPGGTTVGSEAVYEGLREIAADRPVVAVLGEVAASGGYIAALAADHVVARGNTITGSVGVIYEYPDVTALMARLGVEMETIRSSELKAEPSPFRPASDAGRAAQRVLVEDSYAWFRDLVETRRALDGAALQQAIDGRVFTGRQALALGLIDGLGDEDEALAYLESRNGDLADLDIHTWEIPEEDGFWSALFGKLPFGARGIAGLPRVDGPRLMSILN